ncbi:MULTISPECIES: nitrophenyl compound nitroreductase subunit ArsF family protein [Aminobacterium]|jgi:hypothetical protein|uniref:nitrophenyl compound nitroreductase subunit ArsF family protein n=1 Tax=Aminobacterium TaxID=81466 RepID=UPI001BCAE4B9|nr:nitrophenyl compound nitroreductase subunit ArsF family protein [Aminobacterium sp. UBA4987]
MERLKKILTNCLLAFAMISIGFALGKHSVKLDKQTNSLFNENGRQVAVYYLHSTFRCITCNTIEKMTWELLTSSYSDELADRKIQWIKDNFQENEALAEQFEVFASCVVVAEMENGVITDYKRLDDVWTLMKDPEAFNRYISDAIDGYLKKTGGKS